MKIIPGYDANKNVISRTIYNDNGQPTVKKIYDEKGNLIAFANFTYDGDKQIITYSEYISDSEGNKKEEKVATAINKNYNQDLYTDEVEFTDYALQAKTLSEFFNIKEFAVNNTGSNKNDITKNMFDFEYVGEDGNQQLSAVRNKDGKIYQKFYDNNIYETFEYNSDGTLKKSYSNDGTFKKYETINTPEGELTKVVSYSKDPDKFPSATPVEYSYHSSTDIIFGNGPAENYSVYTCDTNGNLLEKTTYKADGNETTRYKKSDNGGINFDGTDYIAVACEKYNAEKNITEVNLLGKLEDYTPPKTSKNNIYITDGEQILAAYTYSSGKLTSKFVPLPAKPGEENAEPLFEMVIKYTPDATGEYEETVFEYKKDDSGNYVTDESGNYILETSKAPDGSVTIYSQSGNKYTAKTYTKEPYDTERPAKVIECEINSSGTVNFLGKTEYRYDKNGNKLEETTYVGEYVINNEINNVMQNINAYDESLLTERKQYDESGNVLISETSTDGSGYLDKIIINTDISKYNPPKTNAPGSSIAVSDSTGKTIAVLVYDSNGNYNYDESSVNITTDPDGNLCSVARNGKITKYNEYGEITSVYKEKIIKSNNETEITTYNPATGLIETVERFNANKEIKYKEQYNSAGYVENVTIYENNTDGSKYVPPSKNIANSLLVIKNEKDELLELAAYNSSGTLISKKNSDDFQIGDKSLTYFAKNGNVIKYEKQPDGKIKQITYKNNSANAEISEIRYFNSETAMIAGNKDGKEVYECDKDGKLLYKNIYGADNSLTTISYAEVSQKTEGCTESDGKYYIESAITVYDENGFPKTESTYIFTDDLSSVTPIESYSPGATLAISDKDNNIKAYYEYDSNGNLAVISYPDGSYYMVNAGSEKLTYEYERDENGEIAKNSDGTPVLKKCVSGNGAVTLYETVGNIIKATKYASDPDNKEKQLKILSYTEYDTFNDKEVFRDVYKYNTNGELTEITRKEHTPDGNDELNASAYDLICMETYLRKGTDRTTEIRQYTQINKPNAADLAQNPDSYVVIDDEHCYKITSTSYNNDEDKYINEIILSPDIKLEEYIPYKFNVANARINAYKINPETNEKELVAVYAYNSNGLYDSKESATKINFNNDGSYTTCANNGKITAYNNEGQATSCYAEVKENGQKKYTVYYVPGTKKKIKLENYAKDRQDQPSSTYVYNEETGAIKEIYLNTQNDENYSAPNYNIKGEPIYVYKSDGTLHSIQAYKSSGSLDKNNTVTQKAIYDENNNFVRNAIEYNSKGQITSYVAENGKLTEIEELQGQYVVKKYSTGKNPVLLTEYTYDSYEDAFADNNPVKKIIKEYSNGVLKSTTTEYTSENKKIKTVVTNDYKKYYENNTLKYVNAYSGWDAYSEPVLSGSVNSETEIRNASGNVECKYVFGRTGKLEKITSPDGLVIKTFKNGKETASYTYTSNGDPKEIHYPAPKDKTVTEFTVETITDETGKVYKKYIAETYEDNKLLEYTTYDSWNNPSDYNETSKVKNTYDIKTGELTQETTYRPNSNMPLSANVYKTNSNGMVTKYAEYKYDNNGYAEQIILSAGTSLEDIDPPTKSGKKNRTYIVTLNPDGTTDYKGFVSYGNSGKIENISYMYANNEQSIYKEYRHCVNGNIEIKEYNYVKSPNGEFKIDPQTGQYILESIRTEDGKITVYSQNNNNNSVITEEYAEIYDNDGNKKITQYVPGTHEKKSETYYKKSDNNTQIAQYEFIYEDEGINKIKLINANLDDVDFPKVNLYNQYVKIVSEKNGQESVIGQIYYKNFTIHQITYSNGSPYKQFDKSGSKTTQTGATQSTPNPLAKPGNQISGISTTSLQYSGYAYGQSMYVTSSEATSQNMAASSSSTEKVSAASKTLLGYGRVKISAPVENGEIKSYIYDKDPEPEPLNKEPETYETLSEAKASFPRGTSFVFDGQGNVEKAILSNGNIAIVTQKEDGSVEVNTYAYDPSSALVLSEYVYASLEDRKNNNPLYHLENEYDSYGKLVKTTKFKKNTNEIENVTKY